MMEILKLIDRDKAIFNADIEAHESFFKNLIGASKFLVIGGAGSIGQAVTREIFKRNPRSLHVVDVSENNMVELVRDLRSTIGYIDGDFKTFAIDCGGREFEALLASEQSYDFVLNLSALKHVRSEKDPFTLMRMIEVNILNTLATIKMSARIGASKYFCVSTDKAANPVNMMGASKRIMEMFLMRESQNIKISMARFANVAFSDGSLLHGFNQRFIKRQPISAPSDVRRYFVTPEESGQLCLMSCLLGENRDIFFPKLSPELNLTKFSDIAVRYLRERGFEPVECSTELEARESVDEMIQDAKWPVYFFSSDTTGEKDFEEFFTANETLDMVRFDSIGVIKNELEFDEAKLNQFINDIRNIRAGQIWKKEQIVDAFHEFFPSFEHLETGKYLDSRM
jgi:FlaA1/EpsC-like NDP-sugar epimerase